MKPNVKARYSAVKHFSRGSDNEANQELESIPAMSRRAVQSEPDRVIQEVMDQYK